MVGGAEVTVNVSVCVAVTPLFAETVTVNGDPLVSGGVPVIWPVVVFSVAHDGSPVAVKVAAGVLVAMTVKLPACIAWKVAVVGLVNTGATPTERVAAEDSATGGTPLFTTTRN